MKMRNYLICAVVTVGMLLAARPELLAADKNDKAADKKAKAYPLDTCVVTDEKLGADPGMKPYTFTHDGREVKLCCESCLKDFKKKPAKYMAKIEKAEKKKSK